MSTRDEVARLNERVTELEGQIAELRRHHLRVAEMADVIQELLIPLAGRDEHTIAAAIEKFQQAL